MTPGRIACALAVMAIFCVLSIFFFPAMQGQGPYSVVHGPVTALLSIRAAAALRMAIVRAGLNAIGGFLCATIALVVLSGRSGWGSELLPDRLAAGCSLILRC